MQPPFKNIPAHSSYMHWRSKGFVQTFVRGIGKAAPAPQDKGFASVIATAQIEPSGPAVAAPAMVT